MAEWKRPLPDTAVAGEETHVEDHNAIVAALAETRDVVDGVEAGAAPVDHDHVIADVAALQSKLDQKAAKTALDALTTRVEALEAAAPPEG